MSWIKRNLVFLALSLVAFGLLAVAVVYLLGSDAKYSGAKEEVEKLYAELKQLKELNPSPGDGRKINNITNAQGQVATLLSFKKDARTTFVPIPPIPNTPRVEGQAFSAELLSTLDDLREAARNQDVKLPGSNYNFTFESVVRQVTFKPASLQVLARQLGEVKTLSDILFAAKINAVENLKRVSFVREDETGSNPSDYLAERPKTNDWAVLVPYELTIRCFSSELAGVLNGFANSPHCLLVRALNIEPAPASEAYGMEVAGTPPPFYGFNPSPMGGGFGGRMGGADPRADSMRRRYGIGGRDGPRATQPPPVAYVPPVAGVAGAPSARAEAVLYERAVRVTMVVIVVHLQPGQGAAGEPGGGRRNRTAN